MKLRISVMLIACFLIGFFLGVGIKILYELQVVRPYVWKNPPIIVNCYGEDFSELQMIRAIDFWTVRGEEIGFYEHNPPSSVCENDMLEGFIILRKSTKESLGEGTLASTRRKTASLQIKSAEINFTPGSQNLYLINEHELGHALGYSHVDIVGHIMNPTFDKMGPKFWMP